MLSAILIVKKNTLPDFFQKNHINEIDLLMIFMAIFCHFFNFSNVFYQISTGIPENLMPEVTKIS